MSNFLTPEQKRSVYEARKQRGDEAEKILTNPLFKSTLQALEADIVSKLKQVDPSEDAKRISLHHDLRALSRFTNKLEYYLIEGRDSEKSLLDMFRNKKA
jgi:hypothetical protein